MLVPGTRTDPEFTAVRVQPWDQPFRCAVWIPDSHSGGNSFLTDAWRRDREVELESLAVQLIPRAVGGWLATTDPDSVPDTMLVVLPAFADLLVSAWRSSQQPDFETWVRQVVLPPSLDEGSLPSVDQSWRYDLLLARLSEVESLKRELFVWPGNPGELTATELLGVPHLPELAESPDFDALAPEVADLARALWHQTSSAEGIYRLTLLHRGLDVVAALGRATDPAYSTLLTAETGLELRNLSRRIRDRVGASGWRLSGYADALSWPLHIKSAQEIPADLVSELAIDLLRRAETVALPPAPDLVEWERQLVRVEALRAQRDNP